MANQGRVGSDMGDGHSSGRPVGRAHLTGSGRYDPSAVRSPAVPASLLPKPVNGQGQSRPYQRLTPGAPPHEEIDTLSAVESDKPMGMFAKLRARLRSLSAKEASMASTVLDISSKPAPDQQARQAGSLVEASKTDLGVEDPVGKRGADHQPVQHDPMQARSSSEPVRPHREPPELDTRARSHGRT